MKAGSGTGYKMSWKREFQAHKLYVHCTVSRKRTLECSQLEYQRALHQLFTSSGFARNEKSKCSSRVAQSSSALRRLHSRPLDSLASEKQQQNLPQEARPAAQYSMPVEYTSKKSLTLTCVLTFVLRLK